MKRLRFCVSYCAMKTDKTERQTKALTLFMTRFVVKCYASRCNSWGRPGSGVIPKKKTILELQVRTKAYSCFRGIFYAALFIILWSIYGRERMLHCLTVREMAISWLPGHSCWKVEQCYEGGKSPCTGPVLQFQNLWSYSMGSDLSTR